MKRLFLNPFFLIFFLFSLIFVWLTPWVLVLKLGLLIYFPYEPNGKDRFIRSTGPIVGLFSNNWTPRNQIPQFCKKALVAAEDEKFYEHNGIDIESIENSLKTNKKLKKMKRGGSTITQQLVKNAFLSREKSYFRKAREIEGALLLDIILSKESQLDWYFNVIEFGANIYGLENASQYYFKKGAKNLNPSQCLALVTIIPSPKKWNKSLIKKSISPFFLTRYNNILNNLKDMGIAKNNDIYLAQQMHIWENQNKNSSQSQIKPTEKPQNQNEIDDESEEEDVEE